MSSLTNGLMLKPLISKLERSSRKTGSDTKDPLLPKKLPSRKPLKPPGQQNSRLTKKLALTLTKPLDTFQNHNQNLSLLMFNNKKLS